jgi:aspartate aminotransferase
MPLDLSNQFTNPGTLPARTRNALSAGIKGSAILEIAGEVTALKAAGKTISNFTIGDFNSAIFPIPKVLRDGIKDALDAGQTQYPAAVGVPELREAIRISTKRDLGLDYPDGCVQVGSGARPPIYAAYATLLAPGDTLLYSVPCWNVSYYGYLNGAVGVPMATKPENGFLPTLEEIAPHIQTARMLCLNSPLNPAGTVISKTQLTEICEAVIAENDRRTANNERPLILMYDMVYWRLTFGGAVHYTPVGLVPEMAKYTILVDAVSKCFAGTGLRVGWSISPPWIRDQLKPLIGHMGAWAARAEQIATAEFLLNPPAIETYMEDHGGRLESSLVQLRDGLWSMRDKGLPVDALDAHSTIYLTAHFDLIGKHPKVNSSEDLRALLLHEAGVAIVPFSAFGYPGETGWIRFSVGAVNSSDIADALIRIEALLTRLSN